MSAVVTTNDGLEVHIKFEMPPPHLVELINNGGMTPTTNTVYTYGPTIYVPSGLPLDSHLMEHELFHVKQQGDNPDAWWERYVNDAYFRTEQEADAYRRQYESFCRAMRDRNARFRFLSALAHDLSGPLYGRVIGHGKAFDMIKEGARVN